MEFSLSSVRRRTGITFTETIAFFLISNLLFSPSIFTFSAGYISPSSNTGALFALRKLAGAGSSVAGASLYAASAIFSTMATALPLTTLWPLAIYISITAIIAFTTFLLMVFYPAIKTSERSKINK